MLKALLQRTLKLVWHTVYRLTGVRLSATTHYLEMARIAAGFLAPTEAIARKLPSPRFKPVEHSPGKCMVMIGGYEMRRVKTIPPYNEVAVAVQVTYTGVGGTEASGRYVFWMPVTREEARWGGVDVYGLPKFLADIRFSESAGARTVVLREGGKDILRLEVPRLEMARAVEETHILSIAGGKVLRTSIAMTGYSGRRTDGCTARLYLGDHPIADQIRELALEPVALLEEMCDPFSSVLNKPVVVDRFTPVSAPRHDDHRFRPSA